MTATTLDDVEGQITRGFRFLRFSSDIETQFSHAFVTERIRLAVVWGVVGAAIYDLVYFGDRTMMADVFGPLIAVRFLIFTPFVVACVLAVRRWPDALLYDILAVALGVLSVTLPMAVATGSTSPYLFVYQNGNSAAFLFFVIALRPRFPAIVIGLALMCASHFTTTSLTGAFDAVTYTGIITFYVTLTIFLIVSSYFMEKTDRRNFLNQLRATLLYQRLEENAERDELTGLLNRHSLARVRRDLWNSGARHRPVAAILLDIDHFKLFNDVHGHLEGDDCLRAVSAAIALQIGRTAPVFRFGGEEFLVLDKNADALGALAMAERIRSAIEALDITHRGLPSGRVSASLGIAIACPIDLSLEELLRQADAALYEAKHAGRNTVAMSRGAAIAHVA